MVGWFYFMKETKDTKKEEIVETKPEMNELEKAIAERDEYLAGWQRAKADASNAQKRIQEDMKAFRAIANQGLIEELLSVLQSFELAFANREAWEKADKNWRIGVEYIYTQLKSVLEQNGVVEVNPLNETFDPQRDEATVYEPVADEKQDHVIIRVVEKGYSLNGKLVKVPKVVVGEFKTSNK
ncbi:MAG: nucleotide exchange factor GrpE [Candidatus Taylorbacteria bacterium CG10_big_fil_rev_8_21_14_0_10_41_48]|uniref:Protein GrpE n=1 Tax=Candidatus Taylorbacteria bacterium CG10_big_fil_rev_8_21_14_0_10_41_48 TaxID=1975024 RepID=A0A2M8LCF7_9BACT|nr:MAG: nucleotide exchange factor GrpE [Candidatus Taylorbacteria bacterium CG10_big_fil_rev_8_21_14_0_10_41_48]